MSACVTCGLEAGDGCPWCEQNELVLAEVDLWKRDRWHRRLGRFGRRVVTTGNVLRKDRRVPWPIRVGLAISPFCLLLIGPFDEIFVGAMLLLLLIFWRPLLIEAWRGAGQ